MTITLIPVSWAFMRPRIGSSAEVAVFVRSRVLTKDPEVVVVHAVGDAGVAMDAGSSVMSSGVQVAIHTAASAEASSTTNIMTSIAERTGVTTIICHSVIPPPLKNMIPIRTMRTFWIVGIIASMTVRTIHPTIVCPG
jgi:hypothetical protein